MNLLEQHFNQIPQSIMQRICKPLSEIDIYYFMYYLNYADGSEVKISTQPEVSKYFVEQEFYKISAYTKPPRCYEPGYYLNDYFEDRRVTMALAKQFDIGNGISWIYPHANVCEIAQFGANINNRDIINFYVNHLDSLQQFIIYFKNSLAGKIKAAKAKRLLIPNRLDRENFTKQGSNMNKNIAAFEQSIRIKKYHIDGEIGNVILTARELDCIHELRKGKSSKMIAKALNISPRTVENHIANLINKLNISSKSEIITKLESLSMNIL